MAVVSTMVLCSLSLVPSAKPSLGVTSSSRLPMAQLPAERSVLLPGRGPLTAPAAAAATSSALMVAGLPLPALASAATARSTEFDLGGAVLNLGLSVIFLAFIGYIGKFALDAVTEVGGVAENIRENLSALEEDNKGPVSNEPLFDDSGTGQNNDPVPTKRSKKRLVTNEELERMAPWMASKIDQDAIDQVKKKRAADKKKAGN